MKKRMSLLVALALALGALTGCSGGGQDEAEPAQAQVEATATAEPAQEAQPRVDDLPLSQPTAEPAAPAATEASAGVPAATEAPSGVSAYTFARMADESFGFTLEYPTQWTNLPGRHTVCYREPVEEGDFPARVAVTRKAMAHTPSSSTLLEQFYSYAEQIRAQYDPSTFEYRNLDQEASFMGQTAYSVSYLAYSGDIEVEGYMICCSIGRAIYAFHFCSSYDDFPVMASVMTRIRDSVAAVE